MMKAMLKMRNKKGFTLMEMLIVVAIIAILIAIAIPTFNNALEKSREATDAANLRAAYAQVTVAALLQNDTEDGVTRAGDEGSYTWTAKVVLVQAKDAWQNDSITNIGGVTIGDDIAVAGATIDVVYTQSTGAVTFATAA